MHRRRIAFALCSLASNVFLDGEPPIVRNGAGGKRDLVKAYWGRPDQ